MASSRTPVPTVSARALLPVVGFASRLRPEAPPLWGQVGLDASVAANPDERYPLTKLLELLEAAVALTGDAQPAALRSAQLHLQPQHART